MFGNKIQIIIFPIKETIDDECIKLVQIVVVMKAIKPTPVNFPYWTKYFFKGN